MENSIETIWKQGFLNESSLVAPKVNDLYNQKSIQVVEKIKRAGKINLIALIIMTIANPIVYYFLHAVWEGIGIFVLFAMLIGYILWHKRNIKMPDYGTTSLDYLKSCHQLINNNLLRNEKIIRYLYPIYFLLAMSGAWSAWSSRGIIQKWHKKYPEHIYVGDTPLYVLIIVGVLTLLILYFSDKIYRWDVRMAYGRVFDKLKSTIADMEKLKQEE